MIESIVQFHLDKLHLDPAVWGIWLTLAVKMGIVAGVFLPAGGLVAMFCIWWERKVAAHMQGRLGPMHTGAWHGWAQSLADGIKLLRKEDLIPKGADHFLFRLAVYLAFAPVFAAMVALPFGPQFTFESGLNIGVLYLLAVLGVEVMGVILAGWGSNSKWAIYGAMREACQMVSYEVPLGIAIICGVLTAGTLDLMELSYLQGGGLHKWFLFHNPFIFIAFMLYFVASLASNKRAPFDLPESESELVAGFHTEYSGLRWSLFFFAEYNAMFVVGVIQAVLFMGGWHSPLAGYEFHVAGYHVVLDPIYALTGYDPVAAGQSYFNGAVGTAHGIQQTASAMGLGDASYSSSPVGLPATVSLIIINLYCTFWVIVKALAVVFVQMWLRWTLPRIRIDQVLYACVKVLLPMSLITFAGTAAWVWLVPQPAPGIAGDLMVARLGHLVSGTPILQLITQILLTAVGVGVVLFCVAVVGYAWLTRAKHPPQSFFPDIMPVGNQVAFTAGKPADAPAAEAGAAQAEPA